MTAQSMGESRDYVSINKEVSYLKMQKDVWPIPAGKEFSGIGVSYINKYTYRKMLFQCNYT